MRHRSLPTKYVLYGLQRWIVDVRNAYLRGMEEWCVEVPLTFSAEMR